MSKEIIKTIEMIDENGEENKLVVSESRVYFNQISPLINFSTRSLVVNTGTNDCFFRCGSLDQIAELVSNANARKSTSSGSGIDNLASLRNFSYSLSSIKLIDSSTSVCLISNCCSDNLDLNKHSSLCLNNSFLMNSGARKSALIEENKYADADLGFIIENKELLSNTSFIFDCYEYSSLCSGDIEFSNSSLLLGESSESNSLNLPFLALLPKSTDHLINSCSSLELNCSINCCLLSNSCLTNSEKFIQANLAISDFNSSSAANVIDAIYILPLDLSSSNFLSSCIFLNTTCLATSATFTSGNCSLNFFNNSSGTDTVTLGILNNNHIYFNTSNYFDIFKSFDFKGIYPLGEILMPSEDNCSIISLSMFSSANNRGFLESDEPFIFDSFGGIIQSRKYGLFGELRKISIENFINTNSSSKQFYYLPNHNSCSFECWSSSANFIICNNIFINLGSHCNNDNGIGIFKDFGKSRRKNE